MKRPAPVLSDARRRFPYAALRYSIAAAALALAVIGERLSGFGVNGLSGNSSEQRRVDRSAYELQPATESVVADGAIDTPASYGVYIDDLVGQDDSEQDPSVAEEDSAD